MDRWMDGQMDRWMNGWKMDGKWIENGLKMDGWMNKWIVEWMDE